ncbi:type II toxin-antitoxin system VapC family toxin [Xenorhabdus bovienii]|uniref:type II toxin-antitoxin system VapC family toxin n=1 Tax=Xenorhabdus bovienii TaxID=40576 RepID=UPI00237C5FEB|nr:type II toxin-antitoxin system VapC family toxin [Xenorhabdus bovienii]MDE1483136.1 type II toxin-antitoxin system VapC family toxin [Xenorhabdus bovienii]MDE9429548.1 type II toxin-antitoxin system VapC family toxin [Xenorhabdus bovienii]MDE9433435.1 type II toxin-antitoxin system VapC family toxin [Xenorhabdus bovienii]MDE9442212.1 type II toxin-antitoxin system VapC family toxin [Xenorhabdus bovienii]MDE9458497.1 type II toxin-antitoxin system VapC family toxin [Xenorhabdus bovienii]
MIVLDTNVISETLRQVSEPRVIEWLDSQPIETLYLSTITLAELRFGMASLPPGKRRDNLQKSLESRVLPLFAGRLLPFDMLASQSYGELMAKARTLGLAISKADGYIAATAIANGMMVATRDVSPFKAADVDVINPWES